MKDIRKKGLKTGKRDSNPTFLSNFLSPITQIKTKNKTHKTRAFSTVQPWDFLLSVAANLFKL